MEKSYFTPMSFRTLWVPEERGNIADNVKQIIEQNEDRRLLMAMTSEEVGRLISAADLYPFRRKEGEVVTEAHRL